MRHLDGVISIQGHALNQCVRALAASLLMKTTVSVFWHTRHNRRRYRDTARHTAVWRNLAARLCHGRQQRQGLHSVSSKYLVTSHAVTLLMKKPSCEPYKARVLAASPPASRSGSISSGTHILHAYQLFDKDPLSNQSVSLISCVEIMHSTRSCLFTSRQSAADVGKAAPSPTARAWHAHMQRAAHCSRRGWARCATRS